MRAYVLMVSGQHTPLGVFDTPGRPSQVPEDAEGSENPERVGHRQIAGEWRDSKGNLYTLVVYTMHEMPTTAVPIANREEVIRHLQGCFKRHGCMGFWVDEYANYKLEKLIELLQGKKVLVLSKTIRDLKKLM